MAAILRDVIFGRRWFLSQTARTRGWSASKPVRIGGRTLRRGALLSIVLCCWASAGEAQSGPVTTRAVTSPLVTTRPSEDEVRRAVRQLNHPSLSQRRAAIRRLAGWGPLAFPELRRASKSGNLEAALSARDLLEELESAILIGADVRLEVSQTRPLAGETTRPLTAEASAPRIAWDEPITITVCATNPTAGPLRVPWAEPGVAASRPAGGRISDHEQVARMMDAADFLVVTGPDGRRVELRVEPIDRDPDVFRAVDVRARGTPPSHLVPAGQAARLEIPLFNRGWARYPLLAAGRYTLSFEYQPQWKDASWTKDGFGCVRGRPITIEVTNSAPAVVRNGGIALKLSVRPAGSMLQAVLESTWDLPLWINTNLGGVPKTHARLDWQVIQTNRDNAEPTVVESVAGSPTFDAAKVVELRPGESVVLSTLPAEEVRRALGRASGDRHLGAKDFSIQVHYSWLSNPTELRDVLSERGHAADVPTQMFSGAVSVDVSAEDVLRGASTAGGR
jgi:hypothetical protein